jgi:GNAT superfamily N-acetyltransferase
MPPQTGGIFVLMKGLRPAADRKPHEEDPMLSSAESTIEAWPPAALDVRIRGASVRDHDRLCALFEEVHTSGNAPATREAVASLLRDRRTTILVASAADGLAAMAVLRTGSAADGQPGGPEQVVAIRGLLVRGDCRGRRVGRRLLAAVVEWARQRRAIRVEVPADALDAEVARFYTAFGFADSQEGMRLAV